MSLQITIVFTLGVLLGAFISNIFHYLRTASGTLKIDSSNPEKDVYRLELGSLDGLDKKRRVILKVDSKAKLSPK